jgi:hypothetical protein
MSQWESAVASSSGLEAAVRPRLPKDGMEGLSNRDIVDELARFQFEHKQKNQDQDQELAQACDAPEAIRGHLGGVALLIDRPAGIMLEDEFVRLPSRPVEAGKKTVCPSETGGDTVEIDSTNGGTLFFIDRHHLVSAGHNFLSKTICSAPPNTVRLNDFLIAFGVTNRNLTAEPGIEIPRDQLIEGTSVTVVECHGRSPTMTEADWVLLRTDDCIYPAKPLPVRWDRPATKGDTVHTLGHPNHLTMKYSLPNEVALAPADVDVFRLGLATDNGHSGAPIFDDKGFVIGIHNGKQNRRDCTLPCKFGGKKCCRRTRCSSDDCSGDGYASHIRAVEDAWIRSKATISSEGCNPP